MKSPYNPTADDITRWAYDAAAFEPVEDWDIVLSVDSYESLFVKLAAADDCPKQEYFLALLYLIVGDAVRSNYHARSLKALEQLIELPDKTASATEKLSLWVKRSKELMAQPETFSYEDWCAGGLARKS